jgi:hypothetical protein
VKGPVRKRGWSRISYSPDKQGKVTQTVLEQAQLLAPAFEETPTCNF